jgi:exodeoxyribonuclease VII large subunit
MNQPLSLFELNNRVRDAVEAGLPDTYWVHAELSSVSVNVTGHCFLELVQKDARGNGLLAKARANIWVNRYRLLAPAFEQATGMTLTAGISVLLQVTAEFHELYGLSYTVHDIDPAYTLGDMARRRREILLRLQEEGTLTLNKELTLPMVPRRIAVVSSATAAGYGDFCRQLTDNAYGFAFRTRLFPAIMQGDRVEASVIAALDAIAAEQDDWDVVVIIRGGGAVSDLVGFDTYDLASNCAQFPLPVITGIGHDRDETVLDIVAHTSVKTPTAVADFLVECMVFAADHLQQGIGRLTNGLMLLLTREQQRLQQFTQRLPAACTLLKTTEEHALERRGQRLATALTVLIQHQRHRLELIEKVLEGASPERILKQGYSITFAGGHAVRNAADVQPDEILLTRFADGEVYSKVLCNESNKES